jgi:hypothetical protein
MQAYKLGHKETEMPARQIRSMRQIMCWHTSIATTKLTEFGSDARAKESHEQFLVSPVVKMCTLMQSAEGPAKPSISISAGP